MSIVVFWITKPSGEGMFPGFSEPKCARFGDSELLAALARVQQLRNEGCTHVCISTELSDSIGKPGVSSVEDGKTPDGQDYTWMKRRTQ